MYALAELWISRLAQFVAILGGAVLIALVLLSIASITGRNLIFAGLGPIPGDFELVEVGTAFAVFAFLPYCQLHRAHARVDILSPIFGAFLNRLVDAVVDVVLLCVWVFLIYRLHLGTVDKMAWGETTFILQFPVWWGFAAAEAAGIVLILVSAFCAVRSFRALLSGGRFEAPTNS